MTRKQTVLQLLYLARISKKPYLIHDSDLKNEKVWISGGWRPVWYFVGHRKGGSAGYIRLWELKGQNLVPVEMKIHNWSYWNETKLVNNKTWIYRLDVKIKDLPFTNIQQGIEAEKFTHWKYQLKVAEGDSYPLFN